MVQVRDNPNPPQIHKKNMLPKYLQRQQYNLLTCMRQRIIFPVLVFYVHLQNYPGPRGFLSSFCLWTEKKLSWRSKWVKEENFIDCHNCAQLALFLPSGSYTRKSSHIWRTLLWLLEPQLLKYKTLHNNNYCKKVG